MLVLSSTFQVRGIFFSLETILRFGVPPHIGQSAAKTGRAVNTARLSASEIVIVMRFRILLSTWFLLPIWFPLLGRKN